MEIKNFNVDGAKVTSIYNGNAYYFHEYFGGLVCVAERSKENDKTFKLFAYNSRLTGTRFNSLLLPAVKRFIKREENKFITCEVRFLNMPSADLANKHLQIEVI